MKKHTKYLIKNLKNSRILQNDLNTIVLLLETLLLRKEELLSGKGSQPPTGLCAYVTSSRRVKVYLYHIFKQWEHYSGDVEYPVPSVTEGINATQQYVKGDHYKGDVGKLRLKLAKFVMKTIEKDIKKLKRKGFLNVD